LYKDSTSKSSNSDTPRAATDKVFNDEGHFDMLVFLIFLEPEVARTAVMLGAKLGLVSMPTSLD